VVVDVAQFSAVLVRSINCMLLCCCLIYKFIDIQKRYPLLHRPKLAPSGVYESSQPRQAIGLIDVYEASVCRW